MNKGISEEFKRLYTYCGLNKNGDNIVAKISDVNGWKKEYLGSFKKSYISELEKPNSVRLLYCDPDTTYKKGFDHQIF